MEYVLDANVFIHTAGRTVPFEDAVTVPGVVDELDSEAARNRFELSTVDVYEPGSDAVEQVDDAVEELTEDLSDVDVRLLALAVARDATVVTDDYGVQNVAEELGVDYLPFDQEGIEEQIDWKRVCRSCGAAVEGDRCSRCGGEPERVPRD